MVLQIPTDKSIIAHNMSPTVNTAMAKTLLPINAVKPSKEKITKKQPINKTTIVNQFIRYPSKLIAYFKIVMNNHPE